MANTPKESTGPDLPPFDGDAFGTSVAAMVRNYVDHELKNLRAEFEMKIEKAYSAVSYQGVHAPDREYSQGNFVSYNGSIWHANRTTRQVPGTGGTDWTLACKRGRDGKDGGR